jgi:general secretion pathway protein L
MRDGLLIRWRGPGEALEWLRVEGGRAGVVQREQRPAASVLDKAARIAVLVPAEDVLSIGLDLPAKKADAARKAAAFAAEEQVAAPIESVHVAIGEAANDGRWPCAVIARPKLAAIQSDLAQRGIAADAVHVDAACLGAGRALRSEGRVLARLDRERALACDDAVWTRIARSHGLDAPDAVDELLPELARGLAAAVPVNLLQGEFVSAHRGSGALRWWRWAAVLALVAALAQTLWMQLDAWRLQARLDALNTAMVQVYRERFPNAQRVPNPRLMLDSALKQAGAAGQSGDSGLALLARAAPVLGNQTQVSLIGAEYRGGQLELRVDAPDIGALDALREGLASALGRPVTLESATAERGRIDGRLRVGAKP